jgi:hypothetical protein
MSLSRSFLRNSLIALALICSLLPQRGAGQATQRVGLNDAFAVVRDGDGLINWHTTVNNEAILSFQYKSFVSFKINNHVYTNNDQPAQLPAPAAEPLPQGKISRRGPKTPGGIDTVTIWWKNVQGIEIFQDVFAIPVADGTLNPRCQIGVKYRFYNPSGAPVDVQTQYLLDVAIAGGLNSDGAKTLTRHGYKRWARYGRGETLEVPPFFINFENELPNAPTYDPGISGQGWFINDQFKIKPPYRVTIGHWPTLERISWGTPFPLPPDPADPKSFDNSILMEWDGVTAPAGDTVTGPSFTYGTGDFQTCSGKLFALLFVPRKLLYDKPKDQYIPNPFTLDAYIFNPEQLTSASNVKLKLDVGQNLSIVGSADPKSQQVTPNPDAIMPLEVTTYSWKIKADLNRPCTGPIFADMFLSAASSLGPPSFIDLCNPVIELPCTELDILPPVPVVVKGTEVDTIQEWSVSDKRADDRGLEKVEWVFTTGDPFNFDIRIGTIDPCTKKDVSIVVEQKDSTKGGCLIFTFTDCVGNFSTREMCFTVHDTVPTPDLLPPVFELIERVGSYDGSDCNSLRDSIKVTELRDHDKGLASLMLTPSVPPVNMRLVSAPITNKFSHSFSVEVIDRYQNGSISVIATDLAGNTDTTEYTYCTIPDIIAPRINNPVLINNKWSIVVEDSMHWDRFIDEITITGQNNVRFTPAVITKAETSGKRIFTFEAEVIDSTKQAGFCVYATDLAGNKSGSVCPSNTPPKDVYPPVIVLDPPQSLNPWKVSVNINDIHYRSKNDSTEAGRIPYDTGIQEIWFDGNTGMTVSIPAQTFSPPVMAVPFFDIHVTDTNDAINETACITIHARDAANNTSTLTWCYPIQGDKQAPVISGVAASNTDLDLVVTDDKLDDRGLRRVELLTNDNFQAWGPVFVSGDKSLPVKLVMSDNGKSAVGKLEAMDMWGSNATRPEIKAMHTSSIDLAMWVQPFKMKPSHLIKQSGEFMLPVFIDSNDKYPISVKGIDRYEFSFTITGDPGVTFVRAETDNTSSAGWTVNPTVTNGGRDVTIVGIAPANTVMNYSDSNIVVKLIFTGAKSEDVSRAEIVMTPNVGRNVILNDGKQTTITGQGNATAILPAPQSYLNGAAVVVAGSCTPLATTDKTFPKVVEMGPISPNPVTGSGRVYFGLPKDASANLRIFNAVGEPVQTIIEGEMQAGNYEQYFDISGISGGTYYLRLESGGQVVTKVLKIAR